MPQGPRRDPEWPARDSVAGPRADAPGRRRSRARRVGRPSYMRSAVSNRLGRHAFVDATRRPPLQALAWPSTAVSTSSNASWCCSRALGDCESGVIRQLGPTDHLDDGGPVGIIADRDGHPLVRRRSPGRHLAHNARCRLPSRSSTRPVSECSITGSAVTAAPTSICATSISWPSPVRRLCSSAASSATVGMHTHDRVGGPTEVARRTVGIASGRGHPRQLFEVQRPPDVIAPRALRARGPGMRTMTTSGLIFDERVVVQTELLHHAR